MSFLSPIENKELIRTLYVQCRRENASLTESRYVDEIISFYVKQAEEESVRKYFQKHMPYRRSPVSVKKNYCTPRYDRGLAVPLKPAYSIESLVDYAQYNFLYSYEPGVSVSEPNGDCSSGVSIRDIANTGNNTLKNIAGELQGLVAVKIMEEIDSCYYGKYDK